MKKILFSLLIFLSCQTFAQQAYETVNAIHYYSDVINKQDSYTDAQCVLDLYYPRGVKDFATIIWFHGGGLTGGHREIPQQLMDKGYAVVGVGYRFSPKVKAPAYIEDAAAATAWVFQHIQEYGGSSRLIFLSGHSAGGYLDMMITLDKHYLKKYNIDANAVAGLIPFSGQCITHFTVRQERGMAATQPVIDTLAPLYFVRKDAPPMLLITGDRNLELYGRYEENAYMHRMLLLNGSTTTTLYELQGYDHGGMPAGAYPLLLKEVDKRVKEIRGSNK
ncbi:alpha/beta hydrolase [Parafilimonas sp.]|uniref:alpha/beta hydrolase n=1 Tax=Parafilimonas sp. TaxID=1969739 RepID=UPI0039E3D0B2